MSGAEPAPPGGGRVLAAAVLEASGWVVVLVAVSQGWWWTAGSVAVATVVGAVLLGRALRRGSLVAPVEVRRRSATRFLLTWPFGVGPALFLVVPRSGEPDAGVELVAFALVQAIVFVLVGRAWAPRHDSGRVPGTRPETSYPAADLSSWRQRRAVVRALRRGRTSGVGARALDRTAHRLLDRWADGVAAALAAAALLVLAVRVVEDAPWGTALFAAASVVLVAVAWRHLVGVGVARRHLEAGRPQVEVEVEVEGQRR